MIYKKYSYADGTVYIGSIKVDKHHGNGIYVNAKMEEIHVDWDTT